MTIKAKVIAVEGDFAMVETQRNSACDGCHKMADGEECSVCSLMGGKRTITSKALNRVNAVVGDEVIIESNTVKILWYAVLVFILPIVLAIVGYFVAVLLGVDEWLRPVAACIGFVGTFLGIFAYSSIVRRKRCDIEIVEIVNKIEKQKENE